MKLIKIEKFETAMTSLQVAEITGKEHKNVIRDIEDESSKLGIEISQLIFEQSEYTNERGKIYKMYNLSKDGTMQLGARYDAVTRFKMIQRIGELEKAVSNRATPAVPYKNGGAHWLPSEDVELEQMELRGVARREMAEHFGRSLKAISNRIDLLLPSSRKTITKNHNLKKYIGDKVETCNLEDVVMYMFLKMKWNPVQVSEKLEIEKSIIVNMLIEANLLKGVTLEIETVAKTLKKLGNPDSEIAKVLKIELEILKFII
ncbi:Rha family transcriptional regulator [Cetobacterium somerae]|uniref:Rha family transcriptional regulator n=1 Tax=Cetobacterium somerae TaxID=188913 RepID=UPI003D768D6E